MSDTKLSPELSKYFSDMGKKGGKKLFAQRGSEYYKALAAKRKTHGREKTQKQ